MQIQVHNGIYCDALRIVWATRNIYSGFFQKNRFIVLPRLIQGNGLAVYLPQIDFAKIENYWDRVNRINNEFLLQDDPYTIALIQDVEKYLIENNFTPTVTDLQAKNVTEVFTELAPKYFEIVNTLLRKSFDTEKLTIRIFMSSYHTGINFSMDSKEDETQITLRYRPDMPINSLFEGITSLIVKDAKQLEKWQGEHWKENESIVDFLMHFTKIADGFAVESKSTLQNLDDLQCNTELSLESRNYYAKLGFPIEPSITVDNDKILINKAIPLTQFTDTETKLLKYLAVNKQKIVRFDELGNIIWNNDSEKYSLWAISKYIQRIREKLVANGLNQEMLKTKRGYGYYLYD